MRECGAAKHVEPFFGSKAIALVWHRRPDAIPVSHATWRHELHTWEDTKCRKTWAYILIHCGSHEGQSQKTSFDIAAML